MIIELFLEIVFGFVYLLTDAIPNTLYHLPDWILYAMRLIRTGLGLFPSDVWLVCLSNGIIWLGIQFIWAIFEWVYKKIPGVS